MDTVLTAVAARWRQLVAVSILLGVFGWCAKAVAPFVPDDAYISFRYARHAAQGYGYRFNKTGPAVEGYSNFLWVAVCAAASRAGITPHRFGPFGSLAVAGGALLLLAWFMAKTTRSAGLLVWGMLPLMLSGPFLLYAVSGMETPFFGLWLGVVVLAGARLVATHRTVWLYMAAAGAIAAALTRPEGILVGGLLAAALLQAARQKPALFEPVRLRRHLVFCSLLFCAALGSYFLWKQAIYGTVLPNPFYAKSTRLHRLLATYRQNRDFFFIRQNHFFMPYGYYFLALGIPAVFAWVRDLRRKTVTPAMHAAGLQVVVLGSVYLHFVDWMPAMRYHVPLLIPLTIMLWEGYPGVRARLAVRRHAWVFLAALSAAQLFTVAQVRLDGHRNEESTRASQIALGTWLSRAVPTRTLLAVSDVGAIPYFSKLPTLDIHPQSLTNAHILHHSLHSDYFFAQDPGVVAFVSFSPSEPRFYLAHLQLYEDPRFHQQYRLIGTVRYSWLYDRCYWVWVRKDIPVSEEMLARFPKGLGSN